MGLSLIQRPFGLIFKLANKHMTQHNTVTINKKMITYTVKVDEHGAKYWYVNNKLHREDGPAIEYASGSKSWYVNDKRHREDGPAIECADGTKYWYVNDKRHRSDGPAVEGASGTKSWYVNGKLHREDGPAVEWADGSKSWYVNGKELTEEQFNNRNKHKPSCEGKIVEVDGVKYKLARLK